MTVKVKDGKVVKIPSKAKAKARAEAEARAAFARVSQVAMSASERAHIANARLAALEVFLVESCGLTAERLDELYEGQGLTVNKAEPEATPEPEEPKPE